MFVQGFEWNMFGTSPILKSNTKLKIVIVFFFCLVTAVIVGTLGAGKPSLEAIAS